MERSELESLVAEIEAQEAELRFPTFSNTQAIALGAAIAEKARSRGQAVTVDIRRAGQQLFHCALDGTSPDNDQWAIRKARVVERFGHSSFLVGIRLKLAGLGIEEKYCVSPLEYSAHGGAFPVFLEGTGLVGTITVSGLPQEDDHALVVESIREFLS
ncbi:MAG: heme-degrading domain-containing protein [Rectinemataceae bacterium]|jgi:uncharacterized protein (UPF0303 family)